MFSDRDKLKSVQAYDDLVNPTPISRSSFVHNDFIINNDNYDNDVLVFVNISQTNLSKDPYSK